MVQPAAAPTPSTLPTIQPAPAAPAPQGQGQLKGGKGPQSAAVQDGFQAAAPTTQRAQGDSFQAAPQGQMKKVIDAQPDPLVDSLRTGWGLAPAIGRLDDVKE